MIGRIIGRSYTAWHSHAKTKTVKLSFPVECGIKDSEQYIYIKTDSDILIVLPALANVNKICKQLGIEIIDL